MHMYIYVAKYIHIRQFVYIGQKNFVYDCDFNAIFDYNNRTGWLWHGIINEVCIYYTIIQDGVTNHIGNDIMKEINFFECQ